jgi:hypothetical protein
VFRVKQGEEGGMPTLALFEADGGKWKIDAALAVRDWFKDKVGSIPGRRLVRQRSYNERRVQCTPAAYSRAR